MKKALIVFFVIIFFSATVFGTRQAIIEEVSGVPVERDDITLRCEDGFANDCSPTMFYYLTQGDSCSQNKPDYTQTATDGDGTDPIIKQITLECPAEGFKHLCLLVEKNDHTDPAYATSDPLNIYCTPSCEITKPTTSEPFIGALTDSTSIEFNINKESISSYNMKAFDPNTGDELCRKKNDSPQGNSFSENCRWNNADPAEYATEVSVTDQFGREATCTNNSSIVLQGNTPPRFRDFTVTLFGYNEPVDNAFSLNDLVHDLQNDVLAFELTGTDCTREDDKGVKFIEDVTIDEDQKIDIGKVNVNPDPSDSCTVNIRATETSTDEHYQVDGSFKIEVRNTGFVEARVKKARDNLFSDADDEGNALFIDSSPGQTESLDVEIANQMSPDFLADTVDIYFVLDASGTFRKELTALRSSLGILNTNLSTRYKHASCNPDCVRYGVIIFGGKWIPTYEDNMTPGNGRWESKAKTGLVSYDEVKTMIGNVDATSNMWKEPWFEYTYYSILEHANWRENTKRLIVIITDAPSNGDYDPPIQWNNGNQYKYINPFPDGLNFVASTVKNNNIIFSAIYPNSYTLCEKPIDGTCPGSLQVEEICRQTGGLCIPYQNDVDFEPIIRDLDDRITELLRREKDTIEIFPREDLVKDFDKWWFKQGGKSIELQRGSSGTISPQWKIYVPKENDEGYDGTLTQKLFGYFVNPRDMQFQDSFFFRIKFARPETNADIAVSGKIEGSPTYFNGGNSTCEDEGTPRFFWTLKDQGGNSLSLNNDRSETASKVFPDNMENFTITLQITCNDRSSDTAAETFSVANAPPAPRITPTRDIFIQPDSSQPLFGEPNDPAGSNDTYEYKWDFGDGTPSTGWQMNNDVRYTWNQLGNYIVRLDVKDGDGGIGSTTKTIHVSNLLDVYVLEMKTTDGDCPDNPQAFYNFATKTIFSLDQTPRVCLVATNNTNDPLYPDIDVKFLNAFTKEQIEEKQFIDEGLSPHESKILHLDLQKSAAGSYIFEGAIERHSNENLFENNFANQFITVTNSLQNPISVPETNPALIVVVALSVVFFLQRKKLK